MRKSYKIINLLFISVASASLLFISCGSEKKIANQVFISFYSGSVTVQRSGAAAVPVQVKEQVLDGDIYRTGDKSCLVIQSVDGLVIRFESNTESVITSLKDINKREIGLNKGKILSSVEKLKKGSAYSVKTPTVVASVRGTEFLAEHGEKGSVVAVGKGVVSVNRTSGSAEEKFIDKGKSAVVPVATETIEIRDVNKVETLELSKLEKTPVVPEIEKKQTEELKEIFKETEKNDETLNIQIKEETGLSVDEMKEKYGRIDVITLYNGKVIQGVIVSRGESYRILTQSGAVVIKAKDVKRTDTKQ